MKDYYKILGLPFGASLAEIKSAYRKLAFQFHPDKTAGNKIAEQKFVEITEAYTVLSNKDKSYLYHVEYSDFLNQKQTPKKATIYDYHKDPKQYPREPLAKASKRELDKNGVIAAAIIFIVIIIVSIVFRYEEPEPPVFKQNIYVDDTTKSKLHYLTKDEFYIVLSEEFLKTNDSTLMKIENVDSIIHVLDSLINLNRK